jgi:hypothetical protein
VVSDAHKHQATYEGHSLPRTSRSKGTRTRQTGGGGQVLASSDAAQQQHEVYIIQPHDDDQASMADFSRDSIVLCKDQLNVALLHAKRTSRVRNTREPQQSDDDEFIMLYARRDSIGMRKGQLYEGRPLTRRRRPQRNELEHNSNNAEFIKLFVQVDTTTPLTKEVLLVDSFFFPSKDGTNDQCHQHLKTTTPDEPGQGCLVQYDSNQ